MRNRQLHAALAAFAEEAAWQLASAAQDGAEVPFEIVESGGHRRDTPLYCYRPLTADFIRERLGLLGRLPSYLPAVHALSAAGGLDQYLAAHGESRTEAGGRARAETALRVFLTTVFADSTDFVLSEDRLHRAVAELVQRSEEGRTTTEVVVPILGLRLLGEEMACGDGLVLARGDVLEDVPSEAAWPRTGDEPHTVAVLSWEAAAGDYAPMEHARARLRRLLAALRLYDDAAFSAGPAAWARTGGGSWHGVPLGLPGRPASAAGTPPCTVTPDEEDELRAFCSLVGRRTPHSGELAWALHRFEIAALQSDPAQALTDHLLALRALLEPEGPHAARLAPRLAVLCAEPAGRIALRDRVAEIVAIERGAVAGAGVDASVLGPLVAELADHLRAILRDVLCGHLDPDLRGLADRLLAEDGFEQPTAA
ncbi:hypothetical protein [Paraconexibacter sp.]|uniref:hypothetical protein n=1 Tax=Paraconexibacter sp. TaxID=2949640 RepID=UPI003566BA9D